MRASLRVPPQEAGLDRNRRELNPERAAQLAAIKLRGLVAEHAQHQVSDPEPLGRGAGLRQGDAGWVYLPESGRGSLGAAIAWARRAGLDSVNLIVDAGGELTAYEAAGFADPEPRIWRAEERTLHHVAPAEPLIPRPDPCADEVALLREAGLDVVADHGIWLGEVNGLEVARVGRPTGGAGDCILDVGVGAYDQFAAAAIDDGRSVGERLASVAELVRTHRSAGSRPHPIGRLVRARWLRAQVCAEPARAALDTLAPVPLLIPRPGLVEAQPAAALGERSGRRVVAVFGVGVDLTLPQTAAGLLRHHEASELIVVVPPRDRHRRVDEMLGSLAAPATVLEIDGAWAD